MTNKAFYALCRDTRKTEPDPYRKRVLQDVYGFMWECGISKQGVRDHIEQRIFISEKEPDLIAAYRWLLEVFQPQEQSTATLI